MRREAAIATPKLLGAAAAEYPAGVPHWLRALDTAVIALINVMLAIEVVLVFTSTMARNFLHSSSIMWVDEASPLFLIALAFLGGAVAYSRGQFIAITILVDRAPAAWREFFAAASKAPISTIIMISERTGGYGLLGPAMFAVVTAFILSGKRTIFPAQVHSRLESPFHADEFEPIVLRRVKTAEVMIHLPVCINSTAPVSEAMDLMGDYGLASLPVVEHNKLSGRITLLAIHRVAEAQRQSIFVKEIMSGEVYTAHPDEDLFTILKRFAARDVGNLPVVTAEQPDRPIGLITRSGLWEALETAKEQLAAH